MTIFTKIGSAEVYFLEIVLYYCIVLGYGTMGAGVYYRTFRGHVTPYLRCFFPRFLREKFEKEISITYLPYYT